MRNKLRSRKTPEVIRPARRRRDADIAAVATVRQEPDTVSEPPAETTDDDPVEDAIRRMVEAAYT